MAVQEKKSRPLGLPFFHTGPIRKLKPYIGFDAEKGDFKKRVATDENGMPKIDMTTGKPQLEAKMSLSIEIFGMGWVTRVDVSQEEYDAFEDAETYSVEGVIQTTSWGTRAVLCDAEHKPASGRQPSGGDLVRTTPKAA